MSTRSRSGRPRRRTTSGGHRLLRRLAIAGLTVIILVGLLGTLGTVGLVTVYSGDLPSLDSLAAANLAQASRIYDRNGTLIEELFKENRTVVTMAKISPFVRTATVATEDRAFYSHQGVDYRRLAIATAYDVTHRSSSLGASTITEQLIKTDILTDQALQKTLDRKIKELLLAEELERRYSKDKILELYLNSIFYGNGAFGIEAASQVYFGVHAADLTLPEATYLAGLPQLPNSYDPFGGPAKQAQGKQRWRQVLDAMVVTGNLSAPQADQAYATDIWKLMSDHRAAAGSARDPVTAHFVDYVRDYLIQRYGAKAVYEGGLQVTTSLDLPSQVLADRSVKRGVADYKYKGANTGALLAIDPRDGEIIAMVGSADYNSEEIRGQVNLTGTDPSGYRPVGSSFKPYTYGAALDAGLVTAATPVDDKTATIDGHPYADWDSKLEGMIPLRQALQESRNLPALWTYKAEGGARVVAFARRLGISTPIQSPESIPTTLGTDSLSMMEHLSAYSVFANNGNRVTPHPVLKVVDARGTQLESFDRAPSRAQVLKPETAYLMTDLLKGPPRIYLGMNGHPVAAKSGTTESWTGAYWIGFTPDLAVATYMAHINKGDACTSGFAGLAQGFTASGWLCPTNVLWGEHVGASVWKPFIDGYYSKHPWPADWTAPAGIVHRTVCRSDGNLASDRVAAAQKYDEIFIKASAEPGPNCAGDSGVGTPPSPTPSTPPGASPRPGPSPSPPASPGPGGIVAVPSPSPVPPVPPALLTPTPTPRP